MNSRKICVVALLILFSALSLHSQTLEQELENLDITRKHLPPYSIRKISIGERFTPFELTDLSGRVWTNRTDLERPLLIITGKWALRHDIKKWARYLSYRYVYYCDVLWVFNPDGTNFANHLEKTEKALGDVNGLAVPVAIDTHAIIGRTLKLEYDIPTIIGISKNNRLAFVYESPLNKVAEQQLEAMIFRRLLR